MSNNQLHRAYVLQRRNAKQRGISFLLTEEEWLKIWIDSGHSHLRGRNRSQFVMARFEDKGPYSKDNVHIVTTGDNMREMNRGELYRQRMSDSLKGRKITWAQKISIALTGKPKSEEHREAMRGRTTSKTTKKKLQAARLLVLSKGPTGKVKLTETIVRKIRANRSFSDPVPLELAKELAIKYNASVKTIRAVLKGYSWTHI